MRLLGPALLLLVLSLTACIDDPFIDPFSDQERYFTVYGYLDAEANEHVVRIIPVQRAPDTTADTANVRTLDATVRTINLTTDVTQTWTYRTEYLADSTLAHLFYGRFRPQTGHTYRLEVERADGTTTWAETTVPQVTDGTSPALGPIEGDPGGLTQTITLPGLASPWDIEVLYFLHCKDDRTRVARIPYERSGESTSAGWRFTVALSDDVPAVLDQSQAAGCHNPDDPVDPTPPRLRRLGVYVLKLDDNWDPPNDEFTPELFLQPGAFSNVHNGDGFFGSLAVLVRSWTPPFDLSGRLGFSE